MMPMALQDRAQYLSLALFAQKVVSALMEYADDGKSAKLKPSLSGALDALSRIDARHLSALPRRKVAAFASYEHLRTLEEVWTVRDREGTVKMIRTVLRSAPKDPKTKDIAEKLIDRFSRLQDQALWNFEQPKPVSPKVMQRLCQLA
jgi:hypothetical protein